MIRSYQYGILLALVCCACIVLLQEWCYCENSHIERSSDEQKAGTTNASVVAEDEQQDLIMDQPRNAMEYHGVCSISERQNYIDQVCRATDWTEDVLLINNTTQGILVDDVHKLVYCLVSKAGSISFRTLLGKLVTKDPGFVLDGPTFLEETGFRSLVTLEDQEREQVVGSYKRLLVVRHPLDRLRAVYDDKLVKPGTLNNEALKRNIPIIDQYLRSTGVHRENSFDPWAEILTFQQFLTLIATQYHNGFQDQHWTPIIDRCKMCTTRYDFIIRLETIQSDIVQFYDYLRTTEGDSPLIDIPHKNQHDVGHTSLKDKLHNLHYIFKYIDQTLIQQLTELYAADFRVFGYDWDKDEGPSCKIPNDSESGYCC